MAYGDFKRRVNITIPNHTVTFNNNNTLDVVREYENGGGLALGDDRIYFLSGSQDYSPDFVNESSLFLMVYDFDGVLVADEGFQLPNTQITRNAGNIFRFRSDLNSWSMTRNSTNYYFLYNDSDFGRIVYVFTHAGARQTSLEFSVDLRDDDNNRLYHSFEAIFASDTRIYVVCEDSDDDGQLLVFDTSGTHLPDESFALNAANSDPQGIFIYNNWIFISDYTDDKIYIYEMDGTFLNTQTIDLPNRFEPRAFAIYDDELFIAPKDSDEIVRFSVYDVENSSNPSSGGGTTPPPTPPEPEPEMEGGTPEVEPPPDNTNNPDLVEDANINLVPFTEIINPTLDLPEQNLVIREDKGVAEMFLAIEFLFDGNPLRVFTGQKERLRWFRAINRNDDGTYTGTDFNNQIVFLPAGGIVSINEVTNNKEIQSRGLSITMTLASDSVDSDVRVDLIQEAVSGEYLNTRCAVYQGLIRPRNQKFTNLNTLEVTWSFVKTSFRGFIDNINIEDSGSSLLINISVENELAILNRIFVRRRNLEDQRQNDNFNDVIKDNTFYRLNTIQNKSFIWAPAGA